MSWTAPRTWVTDEVITNKKLNEHLRDNMLVLHDSVRSMLPEPVEAIVGAVTNSVMGAITIAYGGVICVPFPIIVAKLQYNIGGAGGGATAAVRIVLYSEDGQTQLWNYVDVCGAATGVRTIDLVPDISLEAASYIVLICHSVFDTAGKVITWYTYDTTLQAHIANEPDLSGWLTIVGGNPPAQINPTAFTGIAGGITPVLRFLGTP
jgi:hypothetical protein